MTFENDGYFATAHVVQGDSLKFYPPLHYV